MMMIELPSRVNSTAGRGLIIHDFSGCSWVVPAVRMLFIGCRFIECILITGKQWIYSNDSVPPSGNGGKNVNSAKKIWLNVQAFTELT